jgi:hypothetical protein
MERTWIRLWMDTGSIYAGTLAAEGTGMIYLQIQRQTKRYRTATYSSWFSMGKQWPERLKAARAACAKRCAGCHQGSSIPNLDLTQDVPNGPRPPSKGRRISKDRTFNLSRPEKSLMLLAPLSKNAGGFQMCYRDRKVRKPIFTSKDDPDYRALLAYMRELHEALNTNKRFDMEGFRPNPHYVREMKRYGFLPKDADRNKGHIDVYAADRAYWESFWYRPPAK